VGSLNYQLRKVTKARGHSPGDDAVVKLAEKEAGVPAGAAHATSVEKALLAAATPSAPTSDGHARYARRSARW
jgi:hypothetical protein